MTAQPVKYRSVSITVYPITRADGAVYWQFKRRDGSRVTRATLAKAKADALKDAQTLYKGGLEIDDLTPDQIRAIKRMLEADPELRMVDEFLLWHSRRAPRKNLGEALDEFLAEKEKNRGASQENARTLKSRLGKLAPLRSRALADIAAADLPKLAGAARTRNNMLASWLVFFRWCRTREYLPQDGLLAPERIEKAIVTRKEPCTYTAEQLRVILDAVSPKYAGWLIVAAFSGIRSSEIFPRKKKGKSPLMWEDFKWDRGIIVVRAETAKTGRRRVIPICPALAAWIEPHRKKTGRVCDATAAPSSNQRTDGKIALSETKRLGALIGGWQQNALRHSWLSYRAALAGIAIAANEAGNSESEAKKSYVDAMSEAQAREWFGVLP